MDSGEIKVLPRNVFASLKQIFRKIAESEISIPEEDTIWAYFIEKSKKETISPTIKNIRDYYIRENNITKEQFIFFEVFFREYGKLGDKPSDITRTILGKIISNNECFELIIKESDFYISIINNSGEDAADLKDIIYGKLTKKSEDKKLIEFASQIGIEYKKNKSEDE